MYPSSKETLNSNVKLKAVWELNKPEIISLDRLTFYSAETSAVTGSNYRGHLHELPRETLRLHFLTWPGLCLAKSHIF